MKVVVLYAVVLLILASTIFNNVKDEEETHQHEQFFKDMRQFKDSTVAFMSKGGRNTAEDGKRRDEEIARLKAQILELKGE